VGAGCERLTRRGRADHLIVRGVARPEGIVTGRSHGLRYLMLLPKCNYTEILPPKPLLLISIISPFPASYKAL
jgi:hypothetical protein